ncbi:hypothetical protein H5410_027567 [Solanum commersonii]|uniref:Uncharacterized protein n=1 Tax=Solanum commersonii TaxID=4109 RepID=A0A9J5YZJ0_SOLCO|nr:hypothetical protein H5410_027567 [Solanum commersonii]
MEANIQRLVESSNPIGRDKPTMGVYKFNTMVVLLPIPERLGVRNSKDGQGNLVYAYAIPLGFGTKEQR